MADAEIIFRAIAHPARRQIIALLSVSDRSVKELTAQFTISQPAVSQHLRELRAANLVCSQRVGAEQQYRLTAIPLKLVFDWSSQYRRFFDPAGHAWAFTAVDEAIDEAVDEDIAARPEAVRQPAKKGGSKHGR